MQENKENEEMENLKKKVDEFKHSVSDKAEEVAKDAREKAESFAGKTIDAAEKLIQDVFKKNKPEDTDFEEEKIDPRDVEIVELKRELDELRDKYVRLYADFDNARKRMIKERTEIMQTAGKDIIIQLLPVIDDFERAQKALENTNDVAAVKEGMSLIYTKLLNTLTAKGLKPMDSIGEEFNIDHHEAITEVSVPEQQQGKVIDQVEKGYFLNDKIIRFAKVIVGKKSA